MAPGDHQSASAPWHWACCWRSRCRDAAESLDPRLEAATRLYREEGAEKALPVFETAGRRVRARLANPRPGGRAALRGRVSLAARQLPEARQYLDRALELERASRRPAERGQDAQRARSAVLGRGQLRPGHRRLSQGRGACSRDRRQEARGLQPQQPEPRVRRAGRLRHLAQAVPAGARVVPGRGLPARRRRHARQHRRRPPAARPLPRGARLLPAGAQDQRAAEIHDLDEPGPRQHRSLPARAGRGRCGARAPRPGDRARDAGRHAAGPGLLAAREGRWPGGEGAVRPRAAELPRRARDLRGRRRAGRVPRGAARLRPAAPAARRLRVGGARLQARARHGAIDRARPRHHAEPHLARRPGIPPQSGRRRPLRSTSRRGSARPRPRCSTRWR